MAPKLCLVALFDGFHRRHNDLWQAMERSGTVGHFVCKMLELNMSYGPWQSSAWMRTLEDGAMDVSQLFDVNDPLLLRMWPGICKDMEFDDTESQGPEARAAFLKDLPHFPVFNNKGPKASTSRWMSWQASVRFHDKYHHTKLLVALYVAIKKEWVRSADDLWSEGAGQQQAAVGAGGPGATASTSSAPTVKRNTRPLAAVAATQNGKFLNTFTAVLKSMANPDLLTGARMIALLTAGEEKAHARVATEMRSADRTVEFYSDWAQWSWVHPLREAARDFLDPLQLRRVGFTVSFSGPQFAGLLATDPRVGYEDVLAELCVKFLKELLRSRCSSMMWHSSSYPGLLAPLLSEDPIVVQEHLQLLHKHSEAFLAAGARTQATLKPTVQRSCFRGKYMASVLHFARRSNWEMSAALRELIYSVFSGLLQTKMNEDANQLLRDHETRDRPSKVQRHFTQWSIPVERHLLQTYERPEVEPQVGLLVPPRSTPFEGIFQATQRGTKDLNPGAPPGQLPLRKVLDVGTWWSPSAQSQRRAYAEMQLLSYLHEHQCWHLADEAWRAELLPVGQFIVVDKRAMYVVEVLSVAAIVWPASISLDDKPFFSWSTDDSQHPEWFMCFKFDGIKVQSTKAASPLHQRVARGAVSRATLALRLAGLIVPLLEWQASHAFAGVPEACVKRVHSEMGLDRSSGVESAGASAAGQEVLLDLMRHFNADLTPEEAKLACYQCEGASSIQDINIADLDLDVLRDVVLPGDHAQVREAVVEHTNALTKQRHFYTQVVVAVDAHFDKKPMTAAAKAKCKKAKAEAPNVLKPGTTKAHWRKYAEGSSLDFILAWAPKPLKVVQDNPNGRYLVAYPGLGRKSISWTRRGEALAAITCLKYGWDQHTLATGEPCTIPADFFED